MTEQTMSTAKLSEMVSLSRFERRQRISEISNALWDCQDEQERDAMKAERAILWQIDANDR
jgi:hypothetical protein